MSTFWSRWRTTISIFLAAAIFIAVTGYSLVRTSNVAEENRRFVSALVDERVTSNVADCHQGNEFRTSFPDTLRHIVELSQDGASDIDLTGFPQFAAVDPNTQAYLAELERRLNQAPEESQVSVVEQAARDYERDFPVLDCEQVGRELREELTSGGR